MGIVFLSSIMLSYSLFSYRSGWIWLLFALFSFHIVSQKTYSRVMLFSVVVILHRVLPCFTLHCYMTSTELYAHSIFICAKKLSHRWSQRSMEPALWPCGFDTSICEYKTNIFLCWLLKVFVCRCTWGMFACVVVMCYQPCSIVARFVCELCIFDEVFVLFCKQMW